jgi:hypothetical protein
MPLAFILSLMIIIVGNVDQRKGFQRIDHFHPARGFSVEGVEDFENLADVQ